MTAKVPAQQALEALGPDTVLAWQGLRNANRLCDRCQAIPWHLFESKRVRARHPEDHHPSFPSSKIWTLTDGPTLGSLRDNAHHGCHLCTLILTFFLIKRTNAALRTRGANDRYNKLDDEHHIAVSAVNPESRTMPQFLSGRIGKYAHFKIALLEEDDTWNAKANIPGNIRLDSPAEAIGAYWIQNCMDAHGGSCTSTDDPILPDRIIHVGEDDATGDTFLFETVGQKAKYATLSYCWGQCEILTTTKSTFPRRCKSIPASTLTRTFLDALRLVRRLGLRYLWIDALCIVQDSPEDCREQLSKMAQIYSNSTVTIAAVGATRADAGFWFNRNKLAMVDCALPNGKVVSAFLEGETDLLLSGTLNNRAWCYQEIQLSPRVLICGTKEMYFQCRNGIYREGHPFEKHVESQYDLLGHRRYRGDVPRIFDKAAKGYFTDPFRQWIHHVEAYSRRGLTFPIDRLPALSALASRLQGLFDDIADRPAATDYLAGIWRADLLTGLLWRAGSSGRGQHLPFQAPSWSWASVVGMVSFPFSPLQPLPRLPHPDDLDEVPAHAKAWLAENGYSWHQGHFVAECLAASTIPVYAGNPFGSVRSGKIVMYGPVAAMPWMVEDQHLAWWFGWDRASSRDSRNINHFILMITIEHGLILTSAQKPGTADVCQRVGIFGVSYGSGERIFLDELEWKLKVITII